MGLRVWGLGVGLRARRGFLFLFLRRENEGGSWRRCGGGGERGRVVVALLEGGAGRMRWRSSRTLTCRGVVVGVRRWSTSLE